MQYFTYLWSVFLFLLHEHITGSKSETPKSEYRVVCYFTNWAWSRPGDGKYYPENVDPKLCTHINYAFASLNPSTMKLQTSDKTTDVDNKFYEKVMILKESNSALKVLLSIGGWGDSSGDKYSSLVSSASKRSAFVGDAVAFLKRYQFDGLDFDWEYPTCNQGNCGGHENDKKNFVKLLQELRSAFDKENLLLTAAVSPEKNMIDNSYDVPNVSKYLHFINLMTYDIHGSWEDVTGLNAPLYSSKADSSQELNVNFSVNYWLKKGADPRKLVVGVPLYGRSFTLSNSKKHEIGDSIKGAGKAGSYTQEDGILAYYEICSNVKEEGWTKVSDLNTGVYAYKGNQWVGYDDAAAVAKKAKFVRDNRLGGVMVWAIDLDDFDAICCKVSYPLLKTLSHNMIGYHDPGNLGCE